MKQSKLALVTGATSGIGGAVARALSASGMRVFLLGRNTQRLAMAARRIPVPRLAGSAVADLGAFVNVKRVLDDFSRRFPRLDVLVHCAGEYDWSELGSLDSKSFDTLFAINVRAPYLLTQGLTPLLARARGQVIFLNSSITKNAGGGAAVYKATQHAVQGFTDSLRQDLNSRGIRVSSLFPGRTATPRMRRIYAREGTPYRPAKLLRAQDVAQVVLTLTQLPAGMEITDVYLRSVMPY